MDIPVRLSEEDKLDLARIIVRLMKEEELITEQREYLTFSQIGKKIRCQPATVGRKIKALHLDNEVVQMGKEKGINSKYISELLKSA